MLRTLLKGLRHLQCGPHNPVVTQILPATGYYQTRHQCEDYKRFPQRDRQNAFDEDHYEDELYNPKQSYRRHDRYNQNQRYPSNQRYTPNQRYGQNNTHSKNYFANQQKDFKYNQKSLFEYDPVDWDAENLSKCTRVEYVPHPNVENRSAEEIAEFREKNEVKISGSHLNPILSFDEANFNPKTMIHLKKKDWEKPTAIQAETWPVILSNQNLVGICHTGSGKTLCYILPALEHIRRQKDSKIKSVDLNVYTYSPFVLVVVPTRELAFQVLQVVQDFSTQEISSVAVCGGVKDHWYFSLVDKGLDICIATPGRLLALLQLKKIDLRNCTYLVLDEADTMLDMGFEQSVRSIMNQCRPDRQLLMWTATWVADIQDLAHEYLQKHAVIHIGSSHQTANQNITQNIIVCEEREKLNAVKEILEEIQKTGTSGKTILFANTRENVQRLYHITKRMGLKSLVIHGPMPQYTRQLTIKNFMKTPGAILVATDVASRGLDIDGVDYIINYEFPTVVKTYVHRIGRCGRKQVRGTSYTFFTEEDKRHADELIELLEQSKQEVPDELRKMTRKSTINRRSHRQY